MYSCVNKRKLLVFVMLAIGGIGLAISLFGIVIIGADDGNKQYNIITNCTFVDQERANGICKYCNVCCPIKKLCDTDDCYKVWFYAKTTDNVAVCAETFGLTSMDNISTYLEWYANKTFRCKHVSGGETMLVADDFRVDTYNVDVDVWAMVYKYAAWGLWFVLSVVLICAAFGMDDTSNTHTDIV